jgi:membrane-associated phospholipid phosphatase
MSWKTFFQNPKTRTEFILTLIVLIPLLLTFSQFLLFIEERKGIILNDPVLSLYNPIDLTWLVFGLIYFSLILFIYISIKDPARIMIALQAYGLMVLFRIVAMYLTPFEAPEKLLLLNDPFVQLFGKGDVLTKDLFFSGHTGTLFLLFLLADNKKFKAVLLVATILVGIAVLLQHVHYSIDVFVAPFIAYGSYRIIKRFHTVKTKAF